MSQDPRMAFDVRLYFLSQKLYGWFNGCVKGWLSLVKSVHAGLWLGLLSRRAIDLVDEWYYTREPLYRSDEHNLRGLFGWEREAIAAHFQGRSTLLVTSAGAGREVIALRREGFAADGFECNRAMREAGNRLLERHGLAPDLLEAPRDRCPALARRYDGVVVGWSGYMCIQGRRARVELLKELWSLLEPDAPVLLSFFVRPKADRAFRIVCAVAAGLRRLRHREPCELGDVLDPFFQHYFSEDELRSEVAEAGFEGVAFSTEGYGHAVAVKRAGREGVPPPDQAAAACS